MSVEVGPSFRNGLQETFSPRGLVVGLLLLVMAVGNLYVQQSIQRHVQEWFIGFVADGEAQQQAMAQAGSGLPFALDVALPVLLILTLAFLLVNEVIRLVGIRLFGSESNEPMPFGDVSQNFGPAVLKVLVLGGALAFVVTLVNVIPLLGQIIGWVLVLLFVYLRQVIALEDLGFVETVKRSFSLFMEDPAPIAAILFVLGVAGLVVAGGVPFALGFFVFSGEGAASSGSLLQNTTAMTQLLGAALAVLFQVLGIATVTDAYKQARESVEEPV